MLLNALRFETSERDLSGRNDWLAWQLIDSAFPAGGFAHSSGLEAAAQHGEIQNRPELVQFISNVIQQVGRSMLPFVSSTHRKPADFAMIDRYCHVFTSSHVANRASRLQGNAFMASTVRIFPNDPLKAFAKKVADEALYGHFAPTFGAVLSMLEICRETACRIFLFIHLRGLIGSAVRLGIVGPLEGQGIQYQLSAGLEQVLEQSGDLQFTEAAQTSPLYEIWQSNQDRLYSRLFQS